MKAGTLPAMTTISAPADDDPRQRQALARFAAVQRVQQGCENGLTFSQALQAAAQHAWEGRFYSASTIEKWFYRHRDGQFAALHNQPRRDRGQHRSVDPQVLEALLQLRRLHPTLTLKALIQELLRQGKLQPGTFSYSTLHRRLGEAGLDRRSLKAGSGLVHGPTKAFALPLANLLWMSDCMHGPALKLPDGKSQRTFLFALLDDCSRLCVHAQFYPRERLEYFLDSLRQAILARGVPEKLYTDNGAAFRSQHLRIVCANLGIRLIHTKPYHAWSKGKIERYFLRTQTQFLPTLLFQPVHTLDELNRRYWTWIEATYHQAQHDGLDGKTPAECFAQLGSAVRTLTPGVDVERLFLMRLSRRVRKNATVSLGASVWEVASHLRGQFVSVHFDPVAFRRVEVWLNDRFIGLAHRCNPQRNSQLPLL